MDEHNPELISLLLQRNEAAFEQVFKAHFKPLHAYAFTMVREDAVAEEMVQQVFYKMWERMEGLQISGSVTAYLYKAVYHESLNYLKHQKVRSAYRMHVSHGPKDAGEQASRKLSLRELEGRLGEALNELPEQCRTIFQMSRFEELRYREIAERLNLSVKTVENQVGKALKLLRVKLADFLPFILFFF